MEVKESLTGILAVIIALTMIVVVAIPIVDSITQDNMTVVQQNAGYRYTSMDTTEDVALTYADSTYTLNGTDIKQIVDTSAATATSPIVAYIITDSLAARLYFSDTQNVCTLYGPALTESNKQHILASGETLTLSGGTWTLSGGSADATGSYSFAYVPSTSGEFGAYRPDAQIYADAGAEIVIANGLSGTWVAHGTVTGSITTDFALTSDGGDNTANINVTLNTTEQDDGTILISGFRPDISASYGILIAPIDYHVTDEGSKAVMSIANMIPLILIVGVLIMAVTLIIRRN